MPRSPRNTWLHWISWSQTAWLLVALSTPYIVALWWAEYPVMQDLYGHVESAWQWQALVSGDGLATRLYRLQSLPWPNSLGPILAGLLSRWIGAFAAVKLVLSLYLVAWPLAVLWLARELGRSPLLALLALPTLVDVNWASGFYNYLIAKPIALVALGMAVRWARRGRWQDGLLLAASLWILFLGHALLWLYGMMGAGLAILALCEGRERMTRLWPLALAAPVAGNYLFASLGAEAMQGSWIWSSPDYALRKLWLHLGQLSRLSQEELVWAGAAILLIVYLRRPRAGTTSPDLGESKAVLDAKIGSLQPGSPKSPNTAAWETDASGRVLRLWALSFGLLFLFGPLHLPDVFSLCVRQAVFVVVFLVLMPRPRLLERHHVSGLLVIAGLGAAVHAGAMIYQYRGFSENEMASFTNLIDEIPRGKRLYVHYTSSGTPYGDHQSAWHWPKMVAVRRGGVTNDSFAYRSTNYVTLTEEGAQLKKAHSKRLDLRTLREHWDYLLLRADNARKTERSIRRYTTKLGRDKSWHLYRIDRDI